MTTSESWTGQEALSEIDPDIQGIIRKEKHRQKAGLELIASEVRANPSNMFIIVVTTSASCVVLT